MAFNEGYSHYYNLIYGNKNYLGEVDFTLSLLSEYKPNIESILELGCGTGNHALVLAEKGYQVDGVDLSNDMLQVFSERLQSMPSTVTSKVNFRHGDIQHVRMGKKYDAVISLFHVMSYQTSNEALSAAFATAKDHLKPGGLFLFDCWYGPAVLNDCPVTRIKRLDDEQTSIVRIAEPVMFPNENLVEVNYQIFLINKDNLKQDNFHETHSMRYLFQPEVKVLLEKNQFRFLQCCEWVTNDIPNLNSWNVYFLSQLTE
jgi:SAM-dependent methyltransferase